MKKLFAVILTAALLLSGCGGNQTSKPDTGNSSTSSVSPSGKKYTQLSYLYSSEDPSHNYLVENLSNVNDFALQVIDPLIGFDKYGRTRPLMATSYKVSDDGTIWTFDIRKGVKWYTYDMKEYADVTANDFVASIKYILNKDMGSKKANMIYHHLKNAEEYYEGTITDFEEVGVKAIDDYTLQYTLTEPIPYFLRFLSAPCWLPVNQQFLDSLDDIKTFATSNDTMLYSGPYINTVWDFETKKVIELNKNYWDVDGYTIEKETDIYNKEAGMLAADLFLRGDVSSVGLGTSIGNEWRADPEKSKLVSFAPVTSYLSQYQLNFDPKYGDEYAVEDWKKAVNNLNFRKSFFHSVPIESIVKTNRPDTWQEVMSGTATIKDMLFLSDGTEYTQIPPLNKFQPGKSFDIDLALEYKAKAMKELEGKVTFPIQLVYPHTTTQGSIDSAVVFEQRVENALGKDYIDVVLVPYAPTGYMKNVILKGMWSICSRSWGLDFADPMSTLEMYTDNAGAGSTYGKCYLADDYGPVGEKFKEAEAEVIDIDRRLKLYAEAEAMVLENAYSVPYCRGGGGLKATYLDPFSQDCDQFGRNTGEIRKAVVRDTPIGMEEYKEGLKQWEKEREEAMKDPDANWK